MESALGGIKEKSRIENGLKEEPFMPLWILIQVTFYTVENTKSFRPADGLSPVYYEQMLGQVAKRCIPMGEPLQLSDIDINNKII